MTGQDIPTIEDETSELRFVCDQQLLNGFVEQHGIPTGNVLQDPSKQPSWHATLKQNLLWNNGATITVKFLGNPSEAVKNKVKQYASVWEQYANLHFDWTPAESANIRISINNDRSYWSNVGTQCLLVRDQSQPTMHFGFPDAFTTDAEYQRVVCHEFGHAIGAVHEQINPDLPLHWIKDNVYDYYSKPPNNWSRDKTNVNFNNFETDPATIHTKWDKTSIMQYSLRANFTVEGIRVDENRLLSVQDKSFIQQWYPPNIPDMGSWTQGQTSDLMQYSPTASVTFNPAFASTPGIGLGLNYIEPGYLGWFDGWPTSIKATTIEPSPSGFKLHLDGGERPVFGSGASWLTIPSDSADMEIGSVSLTDKLAGPSTSKVSQSFVKHFDAPPIVLLWISGFTEEQHGTFCFGVSPQDITDIGFNVEFSTIGTQTWLRECTVTYIAYSSSKPDIAGGTINAGQIGSGVLQPPSIVQQVNFPPGLFAAAPKVRLALNGIDFMETPARKPMKAQAFASAITKDRFFLNVQQGNEGCLVGARVSWIAMA